MAFPRLIAEIFVLKKGLFNKVDYFKYLLIFTTLLHLQKNFPGFVNNLIHVGNFNMAFNYFNMVIQCVLQDRKPNVSTLKKISKPFMVRNYHSSSINLSSSGDRS